jgi:hypothetical protein
VPLRAQVVDFIGLSLLHDAHQVTGVSQITIVQFEVGVFNVRVLVNVVYALGVEQAASTFDAVHNVALFQQKLSQVASVLAGYPGDEGGFFGCHF